MDVVINMDRARTIGRNLCRERLDAEIEKQIPGTDMAGIEAQRQAIRDRYAGIQTKIDAATTPDEIKTALGI